MRAKENIVSKARARMAYYKKHMPARITEDIEARYQWFLEKNVLGLVNINSITETGIDRTLNEIFMPLPSPSKKQYTRAEQAMWDSVAEKQKQIRVSEIKFRLSCELQKAHYDQKYMIFNTLTVAPNYYRRFMEDDRPFIKSYLEACRWKFKKHPYFGVWELGSETGRLHYHFIHVLNDLPGTDPNKGKSDPSRACFPHLRKLWKYGISDPLPLRYEQDHYTRFGFKWPNVNGVPMPQKPVAAAANYVAKYLQKEKTQWKPKTRTKMSRNLGKGMVKEGLQSLTRNQLIILIKDETIQPKLLTPIPRNLLKKEAIALLTTKLTSSEMLLFRQELKPQLTLQQRLQTSTQTSEMFNWQKIMSTQTQTSIETDTFNIFNAFDLIREKYYTQIVRNRGYYVR